MLYQQTVTAYEQSVTQGTLSNRRRQAKTYVTFALFYNVNLLFPSVLHAAMFVKYLANSYKAPTTVKNYVSGTRLWLKHHRGSDLSFSTPEVAAVLTSSLNSSTYVPNQAPSLTPNHVSIICNFLDSLSSPLPAVKAALLIGYTCFLRSSNLLSPTVTQWGGPHTLRVADVFNSPPGLTIRLSSSKTIKNSPPVFLAVAPVQNPSTCPVQAWNAYVAFVKPSLYGPAFMLDSVTPLTPKPFVNIIRLALSHASVPNSSSFSIHSLRRGAAQAADAAGASKDELKVHGTWSTDSGLRSYVPASSSKVATYLASSLAN